jgi:hypothetical protein
LRDLRAWHQVIDARLQPRADGPTQVIEPSADVRKRLADRLTRLEASIEEIFAQSAKSELRTADYKNLYRLLGSYQLPGPVGRRDRLCATRRGHQLGTVAGSPVLNP